MGRGRGRADGPWDRGRGGVADCGERAPGQGRGGVAVSADEMIAYGEPCERTG